jgi:ferric hydroxamate transport system substrate-binding protein
MKKTSLYGIIAVVVIVAGVGIVFAATSGLNFISPNSQLSPPSEDSSDSEVKLINHTMGQTEITGTPEKIVVLEWVFAEDLLALGLQPVGVADIEGMKKWVNLKGLSLSDNVTDVGLRDQPNLEVIAQIRPDLIIGDIGNNEQTYDELSEIAPTILFDPYPLQEKNISGLEEMEQEFMTIADIVGRSDQGAGILETMYQRIDEAAAAIQASDAAGKPFVLVQAGVFEGDIWLRIWSQNGQAAETIEMLGMENAWDVEYERYGFSTIALEDLTAVQNATLFYIAGAEGDNVFETTYKSNPLWNDLRFVKEGRVYPIGADTWTFGGPISVELMAERVLAAVTGQSQA